MKNQVSFIRKIATLFKANENLIDKYYKSYDKNGAYECLNAGTSFFGTMAKSAKSPKICKTSERICINNAPTGDCDRAKKGGIIVFPYASNETQLSPDDIADWFEKKMIDIKNHYSKKSATANQDLAPWTVGKYLSGSYVSDHRDLFIEYSLSLEVIGIKSDTLYKMAEEMSKDFGYKSILVNDYNTRGLIWAILTSGR